jgi:2-phosphosulfolactate phosphatase
MYEQPGCDARFEWGPEGAKALAKDVAIVVVVDVLSFCTTVDIALSNGAIVYPARWRDESAELLSAATGATLAVSRDEVEPDHPYSLSPASFSKVRPGTRIVLPSPNGAGVALAALSMGGRVLAGCLRNAHSVAQVARAAGGPVAVVAAGEQWPDGALRPSFEDLVGAGAVLTALGAQRPSPEAVTAMAAFDAVAGDISGALRACASGRELATMGFPDDVRIASELDASDTVPELSGRSFIDARKT